MAVGTQAMTCYQGEDVSWEFTVNDSRIASVAGYVIALVIKQTPASLNPPLLGPFTCSITGTLTFAAAFNVAIAPGVYVYSIRRTDAGFSWQLAQGTLTVTDSASID